MPRLPLILAAAGLLVAALVLFAAEPEEPARGDLLSREPPAAGRAGEAGLLAGSVREDAPTKPAADGPDAMPGFPTGPYEFEARSLETERPLPGVEVETGEGERLGTTGPDGRLRIADAGADGISFRARLEGYLPHHGSVEAGGIAKFALQPGIAIAGRVVDDRDGTPAAFARLRVWDVDLEREIGRPAADEEGRFRIAAVRPNRPFFVVVRVEGLVPHEETYSFDVPIDDLEVRVGAGTRVRGTVYDVNGEPWAGRAVLLVEAGRPLARFLDDEADRRHSGGLPGRTAAREAQTVTDEDGTFRFCGVPRGRAVQPVVPIDTRYEARGTSVIWINQEAPLESDVRVLEPAHMKVEVEDEVGRPLRGASVSVSGRGMRWRLEARARRPDGSWLAGPLTPGTWRADASLPGCPAPDVEPRSVAIDPGREATITVTFGRGRALTGVVRDKRGDPVWHAQVAWKALRESASTRTDAEGRFRLDRLQAGAARVTVVARDVPHSLLGFETQVLPGVEAGSHLEIELKDGTAVRGRFPELDGNATLYAVLTPGSGGDAATLWLNKEKGFRKRGPAPPRDGEPGRSSTVFFRTPGFPPLVVRMEKPFRSEERRDLGDLYFAAVDPYLGRVVDESGIPVQAAKVRILEPWSNDSQRTDRDGHFELARVPEQPVRVSVQARGYPPNRATLLPASQRVRQVLRLFRKGTLEVTVLDPHGQRVAKASIQVTAVRSRVGTKTVETDAKGLAKLELVPGEYNVYAHVRRNGRQGGARVRVRGGEATKESIRVETRYERIWRERRGRDAVGKKR